MKFQIDNYYLFSKNTDNFKLEYGNFKESLNKINNYFYKINEDNNIGNDSDTDNTIFDNEDGNSSVETGDTSLLMVIIAMLVVSAGIFSVTVSKRKKIRSNNESI